MIVTALILAGMYIYDNVSLNTNGVTNIQKSNAIAIALNDFYVQQYLNGADNYTVGNVILIPQDYYSYSNNTSRVIVPIDNVLLVTVDLDENRTVSIVQTSPGNPYDQAGMDAIKIVQNDPMIGGMINNSGYTYIYENQTTYHKNVYIFSYLGPHGNSNYGLLNDSSAYVDVSLQIGEMAPFYTTVTATVDNASGRVIMARFQDGEQTHPPYYMVTMLPGVAFYRQYGGESVHSFANYSIDNSSQGLSVVDETPGTAIPQPIFVDSANFEKLKNGTSYQALNITLNCSERGWQANIPANTDFYLVLRNDDVDRNSVISLMPYSFFI